MAHVTGESKGACIMSAEDVYSEQEEWLRSYEANSADQLTHQRIEEEKKMAGDWVQRDNTLNLKRNKWKKADNHPDYKGDALVGGKQWDVGGWMNKDKNGDKYISMKFSVPRDKSAAAPAYKPEEEDDFDF